MVCNLLREKDLSSTRYLTSTCSIFVYFELKLMSLAGLLDLVWVWCKHPLACINLFLTSKSTFESEFELDQSISLYLDMFRTNNSHAKCFKKQTHQAQSEQKHRKIARRKGNTPLDKEKCRRNWIC